MNEFMFNQDNQFSNKNKGIKHLLNKDVKEFNSVILSLVCIGILVGAGLLSYKINSSYALFTDEVVGEKTIEVAVSDCKNNVNKPVLSDNMIPVYYDETCNNNEGCWRKADSENKNAEFKWYDYCEKMWANSVTVSADNRDTYLDADLGEAIVMDDILTMQVWIPRYKYTVWNYNLDGTIGSSPQVIDIDWEKGTLSSGDISCTDNVQGTGSGIFASNPTISENCVIKTSNQECTDTLCNGKTYTHPAFTLGEDELTGIWIGKFELSSDINCTPANTSAFEEGCNLSDIRPLVKPNIKSWRGAMISIFENSVTSMSDSGNKYGFASSDDTHIMKNMEWGALAYLTNSKYGRCTDGECTELTMNNFSSYETGCGPQASGDTTCNSYDTTIGKSSSTTGNVYGIYDVNGGTFDTVMGNIISKNGTDMLSGNRNRTNYLNQYSGYQGILYDGGSFLSQESIYQYPDSKYYDKYSYGTGSSTLGRSKLGDAIRETYYGLDDGISVGWYSDYAYVIYASTPWFVRGGNIYFTGSGGTFAASVSNGAANVSNGSRFVISQY